MAETTLEYTIKAVTAGRAALQTFIKDLGHLRGATLQTNETTAKSSTAAARATTQALGVIGSGARSVVTHLAKVGPAAQKSLHAVTIAAGHAGRALQSMGQTAGGVLQSGLLAGSAAALTLAGGLALLGKRGVEMNVTLDGARMTLTRMSGSAANAEKLLADLRKEALYSSLTFAEMIPTAQGLVAVLGPGKLGAVIPIMRAFGDAATALRVDSHGLNQALYGFRQLVSQPFARQEELNQVNEALPGANIGGILRKQFGTADTESLEKAGVTGMQVGEAIIRGLTQSFGGSQRALGRTLPLLLSGIQDSLNDFAQGITQGLTGKLTNAVANTLDALNKLGDSGISKTLMVVFDAFGNVLDKVTAKLPEFVAWLEKVASAEGVTLFLVNSIALVQTLGQEFAKFFGIDLKALLDPKNVTGWFDAFGAGVAAVINGAFGIGRVWGEVGRILESFFKDTGNALMDWIDDAGRGFKALFLGLELSVHQMTASFLASVIAIADALNSLQIHIPGVGTFGPNINTDPLLDAQGDAAAGAGKAASRLSFLNQDQREAEAARIPREMQRDKEDPYRRDSFGKRISDAFTGTNRDTSAQDQFWANFDRNRMGIARDFFAGTNASAPAGPSAPGAPQMFGTGRPSVAQQSVTSARSNTPALPGGGIGGDPFRAVTLQDGSTTTAAIAMARGVPFVEQGQRFQTSGRANEGGSAAIAAPGGGGATSSGGQIVFAPNVSLQMDPEKLRSTLYQMVDQLVRQVIASPS